MEPSLRAELEALLEQAGEIALSWFGRASVEHKPDGSPVTDADRAVEERLVEGLARAFPGESVRCEEGHVVEGRAGAACWYVDPIDGTGSFVSRLAYWGPTICRVDDGRLHVGAFYVPRLRERWYAEAGGGAWRDDTRLGPPTHEGIGPEDIVFAPSRFHRGVLAGWPGKVRALGSSAAHLALVAAGGGLATVIPTWAMWDVGCGTLLIRESGRVIWNPAGTPVRPEEIPPGLPFLAGAPDALRALTRPGVPGTGEG